jgi:aldose 1-epimerase
LAAYEADQAYLGAVIGRCANRIANAVAVIDHQQFQLTRNHGAHHLHGGAIGFSKALWRCVELRDGALPSVILEHCSPAGDEGYPGKVATRIAFQITSPLSFYVLMQATTDRATPLNLTLHPYFNLSGDPHSSIDDHVLHIDANAILETAPDGIPTGQLLPVIDTRFDFRRTATVGAGPAQHHPQLGAQGGYDHHWILNKTRPVAVDARLFSPTSGIQLHLSTNQPGVQFYSGNFLQNGSAAYFRDRAGLCIEPQGFPNAVNEPRFPSVILHPSQAYLHATSYMYSVAR